MVCVFEQNTKFAWTTLFKGSRLIGSEGPWNESFAFNVFDVIMMNIVTQNHYHTMIFLTDGLDRNYSESWGYLHTDGMNRLFTLAFTTAGRYISKVDVRMKVGDEAWGPATSVVYVSAIYGAHWFN